ncbi:hypothetical protein R52603_03402 [Paraburkholderia saeva]|nr:hypothetical protein R52603_03402 [Paraburkholderia saeva]
MQINDHTFTDVGEHAAFLAGWDQRYFQMDCGQFHSTLQQLSIDGFHLFHESVNRRVVQQGCTPDDALALGIVLDSPSPLTFSGRAVTTDSMILARANREFLLHSPDGVEILGIEVKLKQLEQNPCLASRVHRRLASNTQVVALAPSARQRVVEMWRTFTEEAASLAAIEDQALAERRIAAELLELIDVLLEDERCDARADITWMSHSDVVARAHDMIAARPQEPVTVQQLCEILRISRRTVQTGFRLVTGKSPVEYMRAIRLNFVRELLRNSRRNEMTVRDAAQRWGFFHSGHFTQDYRDLFGTMPSDIRMK